jgi:3-hydroxyacyl-CoA dehydrogenase
VIIKEEVPIELKKHPGYVINLLRCSEMLLADGVAAPETVDKTWRIATGASMGPLQILDMVGLNTAYNIDAPGNEERRFARKDEGFKAPVISGGLEDLQERRNWVLKVGSTHYVRGEICASQLHLRN